MATTPHPNGFLGHPQGLMTLFFTEMWERFSYYGMRAFLVLYITAPVAKGGLGESDATGGIVYAMYGSLAYLMGVPGGWLADRYLGQRMAVLIGGIVIMLGHLTLALPTTAAFYPGLAIIILGTGLLKPNVSTIVGQLYPKSDIRRDAGYTIFYMGINLGAAVAPFVCGFLVQSDTFQGWVVDWGFSPNSVWHFGFGAAGVGMALGVVQFWLGQSALGDAGLRPHRPVVDASTPSKPIPQVALLIAGVAAALVAAFWVWRLSDGVDKPAIADGFGFTLFATAIAIFWIMHRVVARDVGERRRVRAMAVLFFGCMSFFGIFEQAGSSINLFTERFVDEELFFVKFETTWYQSVNAGWIMLMAPLFAAMWIALAKARKEPDPVQKFALGVLVSGLAFLVLVPQVGDIADGLKISGYWMVGYYLVSTIAELCLSPVGLSVMNKLAPDRLAGFVMGIWFLAISLGYYIAGRAGTEVGKIANHLEWGRAVTVVEGNGAVTTSHPAGVFYLILIFTVAVSAVLFALAGPVKRMLAANEPDELPVAKIEP